QLVGRVALPHGPLARSEHADAVAALGLEHGPELLLHDVEGLVPAHRREVAFLVVDAVLLAQQRRGQAVGAVHHLRQEIALDAVQAAVDLGLDVAVGGDHAAVAHRDVDPAAGAAVAARSLAPLQVPVTLGHGLDGVDGPAGHRQSGGDGRAGDGAGADELATAGTHPWNSCVLGAGASPTGSGRSTWW